ncbi:MAG TPA: hypothetical protein VL128_13555 [Candidatus Eisenbacteria bacterium]|nr:hypothetical protein [Candidatus Eisenbacteria bacterium]
MSVLRNIGIGVLAIAAGAVVTQLIAPRTVQAVVSALVTVANTSANPVPTQMVGPSNPYFGSVILLNTPASVGPDSGRLGVTNITLTNFASSRQQVFLFQPLFSSGGCGDGTISGSTGPKFEVYLQPSQTLAIPYPTPLVFPGADGHTCVAAEVTTNLNGGSVEMDVTGFVE